MTENFARLDGAEIFAEGRWNNTAFSQADLDGIVSAFDALGMSGKVPLKLGHDGPDARRDPRTQFAMGWVRRIWRDGKKLKADLDIPDKVHSFIKEGFLKNVSVELLRDVKASNRKIPWVLDAVALLGADQPAVGVLEDLQALTMTRDDFQFASRAAFSRDDRQPYTYGVHTAMADDNKTGDALQRLTDQVLGLSQQVADLMAENQSLKTEKAEFVQIKGRFERLQKDVSKSEINAHRAKITEKLESAVKDEDIRPAARERFNKVYGVDNDEMVMKISLDDVAEFIKENPNTDKRVKRKVFSALSEPDGEVPDGIPVDQEASLRVEAMLRKQGKEEFTADDIQRAAVRLFRANPDLAQRYKANADKAYGD